MMHPHRVAPAPGQESVWDYPRPPRLEPTTRLVEVVFAGTVVARTQRAMRVLETSHPPVYYIPREDVMVRHLRATERTSYCEWKGIARYFDLVAGDRRSLDCAWSYEDPSVTFSPIHGHLAFYAGRVDECRVDGEVVRPQPGGFYGGWITADVVGPFKGDPGTSDW